MGHTAPMCAGYGTVTKSTHSMEQLTDQEVNASTPWLVTVREDRSLLMFNGVRKEDHKSKSEEVTTLSRSEAMELISMQNQSPFLSTNKASTFSQFHLLLTL